MVQRIKTKQSLRRFIRDRIYEQFGELEKTTKSKCDDEDDDKLLLDDGDIPDEVGADEDEATMKKGDVETSDVIEKLNTIRSGRSFRDSSVKGELEQYVDSLDTAERTALFALLKGIAQIVTKEIPAQDAVEPSDPQPSVKMQKTKSVGPTSVKVKPHVISKSTPDEEESLPISPKKR